MNNNKKGEKVMEQKWVLWDIDGTTVEATPGWTIETNKLWEERTLDAKPIDKTIYLIRAFSLMGYKNVFLTARSVTCKEKTIKKLRQIGVLDYVDALYHRPIRYNNMPSDQYKKIMFEMLKNKNLKITHAIDDEENNLTMFKNLGLCTINASTLTSNKE